MTLAAGELTRVQKVQDYDFEKFPIDLKAYKPLPLDPVKDKKLSAEQKKTLVGDVASDVSVG